jgi:choline kinase
LNDDFILVHSDLIFEEELLSRIMSAPSEMILPYDRSTIDSESMKIAIEEGKITGIDKRLPLDKSIGESLPLMKFSVKVLKVLKPIVESSLEKHGFRTLFETALFTLIHTEEYSYELLDITGLKWCEIDTLDDWERAREIFK